MQNKLNRNIKTEYIYAFFTNFNLTRGVWMLYLAYKGLNLFQIGIMESIFHLTSFTMEIPTGLVADIYGRKASRLAGRLMNIISILILILGNNFWFIAISFVVSALSYNLESGAGDALLYDSMKEIGIEDDYNKVIGKREIFFQISATISLILGGYIAQTNYILVYKIAAVIAIIAFVECLFFNEPNIGKIESENKGYKLLYEQFINSINILKNNRQLRFLIIFSEVFALFYTTEFFYIQNYLKNIGTTESVIGIILSIGAICGAIASANAHRLQVKFGIVKLLVAASVAAIFGFWVVGLSKAAGVAFIGLSMVEGIIFVTTTGYINKLIPSEQRATLLSFQSMFFSFLMIGIFPLIGKIGDIFTLQTSFQLIAVMATILLGNMIRIVIKAKV